MSSRQGRGNFSLVSKVVVRYIVEDCLLRTLSSESSSFNKFESYFMINMTYTHLLPVLLPGWKHVLSKFPQFKKFAELPYLQIPSESHESDFIGCYPPL